MNKEETLARFEPGRASWNAWAAKMLEEKKQLEEAEEWAVDVYGKGANDATRNYLERAKVDFSGHAFDDNADFSNFIFPGNADFYGARFSGNASFWETQFTGDADFIGAQFSGNANFGIATFEKPVRFDSAEFSADSGFNALEVKSAFSLAGANFHRPADFIQAHFEEGPRLDNIEIDRERGRFVPAIRELPAVLSAKGWPPTDSISFWNILSSGRKFEAAKTTIACWRALKRLAIQAHDHEQEQFFFRRELLARRWVIDWPLHAKFWFGLFYGWFSDFGRSIPRPSLWLLGLSGACAWLYHALAAMPVGAKACVAGNGSGQWWAAIGVSLKNTLFTAFSSADKIKQSYACLYGVHVQPNELQPSVLDKTFQPVIPDFVALIGVGQLLLSTILIFLILLAVRNHFRIK